MLLGPDLAVGLSETAKSSSPSGSVHPDQFCCNSKRLFELRAGFRLQQSISYKQFIGPFVACMSVSVLYEQDWGSLQQVERLWPSTSHLGRSMPNLNICSQLLPFKSKQVQERLLSLKFFCPLKITFADMLPTTACWVMMLA